MSAAGAAGRSAFASHLERGDLPVRMLRRGLSEKLVWTRPVGAVDLHQLVPLLAEGLRDADAGARAVAVGAVGELAEGAGPRLADMVPSIVAGIKSAMNTRDVDITTGCLRVLQALAGADSSVVAVLREHLKTILPSLSLLVAKAYASEDAPIGEASEIALETLELLEFVGGKGMAAEISVLAP